MAVGVGDEDLLTTDEEGRLTMVEALGGFRSRQTERAQPFQRITIHGPSVPCAAIRTTGSKGAKATHVRIAMS